jgi:hypothetical protein
MWCCLPHGQRRAWNLLAVQATQLISLARVPKQHRPRGRVQDPLQENALCLINQQFPQDYTKVAPAGTS